MNSVWNIISISESDPIRWKLLDFVECSRALSRSNHNLVTHEKYTKTVNILCFVFLNRDTTLFKSLFQMIWAWFWVPVWQGWIRRTKCRTWERIAQRIVRCAPKADSVLQSNGKSSCTSNYPQQNPGHCFGGGAERLGEPSQPPLDI